MRSSCDGEWQIDNWGGRIAIHSNHLPQDAALEIVGLPAESEEAKRIAQAICQALNNSAKIGLQLSEPA